MRFAILIFEECRCCPNRLLLEVIAPAIQSATMELEEDTEKKKMGVMVVVHVLVVLNELHVLLKRKKKKKD